MMGVLSACQTPTHSPPWKELLIPPGTGSQFPNLYSNSSGLYLSWLDESDSISRLLYSQFKHSIWSDPEEIASGNNWFVNWADFPSMFPMKNGRLMAHYLQKNGTGTYAYGVQLASKSPHSEAWQNTVLAHRDSSETEHGFATFFALPPQQSAIVWLDGRAYAEQETGPMSLRMTFLDKDGLPKNEQLLDDRVCDCCQTDAISTPNGAIVVYRNRSEEEIRDIYRVLWRDGTWGSPQAIHHDNWTITGCPVNGPAVASAGKWVGVAWFSRGSGEAKVQLAFSDNEGESFDTPIRIDLGNPEGRVDLVMMENGSAWISWIELEEGKGQLYVRQVFQDGTLSPEEAVSDITNSRASGFPILESWQDKLWLSWTAVYDSLPAKIRLMQRELDQE